MNSDFRLLNEIYQNAITAINAITAMLKKTDSQVLYDCLFDKMREYRKIANNAQKLINMLEKEPQKQGIIDKSALYLTINLAAGGRISDHRLAKILITGSIEGIYDISDYVNICTDACKEARELAYSLIETEEKNICSLNEYL